MSRIYDASVDGGPGIDTLQVRDGTADLTQVAAQFAHFEAINMDGNGSNTLILDPASMAQVANGSNSNVSINADGSDNIILKGTWTPTGSPKLVNGVAYQEYTSGNLKIQVSTNANILSPVMGTAASETLFGTVNDDFLSAGDGDDTIMADTGNDVLRGGAGNDLMNGEGGSDTADYSDNTFEVIVNLSTATVSGTLSGTATTVAAGFARGVDSGLDSLLNIENANGSAGNDLLVGNASANRFSGGSGGDTIDGGAGDDSVLGGDGLDSLLGGADQDYVDAGGGDDRADARRHRSAARPRPQSVGVEHVGGGEAVEQRGRV